MIIFVINGLIQSFNMKNMKKVRNCKAQIALNDNENNNNENINIRDYLISLGKYTKKQDINDLEIFYKR